MYKRLIASIIVLTFFTESILPPGTISVNAGRDALRPPASAISFSHQTDKPSADTTKVFLNPETTLCTEVHNYPLYRQHIESLKLRGVKFKHVRILKYTPRKPDEDENIIGSGNGEIPEQALNNLPLPAGIKQISVILTGRYRKGCLKEAFESIVDWQKKKSVSIDYHFIIDKIETIYLDTSSVLFDNLYEFGRLLKKGLTPQDINIYVDGKRNLADKAGSDTPKVKLYYWMTTDAFVSGITQEEKDGNPEGSRVPIFSINTPGILVHGTHHNNMERLSVTLEQGIKPWVEVPDKYKGPFSSGELYRVLVTLTMVPNNGGYQGTSTVKSLYGAVPDSISVFYIRWVYY